MRTWLHRAAILAGIGVPLFAIFTMVVHLPAVQYAMGWTNPDGTGACPFGYDAPRVATPRTGPGEHALGFVLGTTSRTEIEAWAREQRVTCTLKRNDLECRDVPATLLAAHGADLEGTTIWFELDASDHVRTVKTARRTAEVARVADAFTATETTLARTVGAPVVATGSPAELGLGAFRQATREFRRTGYRALVRATNMGDGYLLTESYTAL